MYHWYIKTPKHFYVKTYDTLSSLFLRLQKLILTTIFFKTTVFILFIEILVVSCTTMNRKRINPNFCVKLYENTFRKLKL